MPEAAVEREVFVTKEVACEIGCGRILRNLIPNSVGPQVIHGVGFEEYCLKNPVSWMAPGIDAKSDQSIMPWPAAKLVTDVWIGLSQNGTGIAVEPVCDGSTSPNWAFFKGFFHKNDRILKVRIFGLDLWTGIWDRCHVVLQFLKSDYLGSGSADQNSVYSVSINARVYFGILLPLPVEGNCMIGQPRRWNEFVV